MAIFSGFKQWDLKIGALEKLLEGHSSYITTWAISEKEAAIFSGSRDTTIKGWVLKTGTLVDTLGGHHHAITRLAISEKEAAISSGSKDTPTKTWDLKTGGLVNIVKGHAFTAGTLAISEKEAALFSQKHQGVRVIGSWVFCQAHYRGLLPSFTEADSMALGRLGARRSNDLCWNVNCMLSPLRQCTPSKS